MDNWYFIKLQRQVNGGKKKKTKLFFKKNNVRTVANTAALIHMSQDIQKVNSKLIKDRIVKSKTIKFLEENIEEKLYSLG